ncbi:MAG: MerR family transcriptional regulator [Paracoccaceae bacterium]
MNKSPDAFRTISEVADWLGTPTHVLRFWESRFTQVKPVKRAGGRRYYRPKDMELLGGIKKLLHGDGMTIRGVQKLLRKEGVRHVANLSPPVDLTGVIQATADEAAIEMDAVPEKTENIVPIKQTSRISALAQKHAKSRTAQPPQEEVASDVLESKKVSKTKEPAALGNEVPDDPNDTQEAVSSITSVAAALRRASGKNAPKRPEPEVFNELYDRLVRLHKSMDDGPASGTGD